MCSGPSAPSYTAHEVCGGPMPEEGVSRVPQRWPSQVQCNRTLYTRGSIVMSHDGHAERRHDTRQCYQVPAGGSGLCLLCAPEWCAEVGRRHGSARTYPDAHEALEQGVREHTAAPVAEPNAVKPLVYRMSQGIRAPLMTVGSFIRELCAACDPSTPYYPHSCRPGKPQRSVVERLCDHDMPEALGCMETAVVGTDSYIQAMLDFSRREGASLTGKA